MASSTAELRLAVQEMVAANDIVQVYLNPALLYGEDGAGNNDWIPNPLTSKTFLRKYFHANGPYGLKKDSGLPLVVRDKRSAEKQAAAVARTGTSCVVDAAGWKAKHEGLETAAIAAADVFYTKHAQGCLEKQPTQREVASKQLSHWMAWIIRKDADFWADERLNGAYVGGYGSYEVKDRTIVRTYLDTCYAAEGVHNYVDPQHVFNGPICAVPEKLTGAEHLFADETFVPMQVGSCLLQAHKLIARRKAAIIPNDATLLAKLKKIYLCVYLPKVLEKITLCAGSAAAHEAANQSFVEIEPAADGDDEPRVVREMAAAKLTAPEVAVEHFAFGSKEEFYIEHLKFKKDAEDKMIFPKKEIKSPPRPRKLLGKLRVFGRLDLSDVQAGDESAFAKWTLDLEAFVLKIQDPTCFKKGMYDDKACGTQSSPAHKLIKSISPAYIKYLEMIPNPVDAQAAPLALKRTLGEMYGNNPAPSQVPSQAAAAAAAAQPFKQAELANFNLRARHLWTVYAENFGAMEHAPIELLSAFVEKFTANENLSFTAKSPPALRLAGEEKWHRGDGSPCCSLEDFTHDELMAYALGGFVPVPTDKLIEIMKLEELAPEAPDSSAKKERRAAEFRQAKTHAIQQAALIEAIVAQEPTYVDKLRVLEAAHLALGITHPSALACGCCSRKECGTLVHVMHGSEGAFMRSFEDVFSFQSNE